MNIEEFREQCADKYRRQLENEEKWQLLSLRQKVFGVSYGPNQSFKHLYRLSCPNCDKKLKKITLYYKDSYDYIIYKCECGYEYAVKHRNY